ncbi:U6 snRNA-associated Sm-like protein LSm2 [Aphelenchoides avenae]|nr:U6 snRNA-associated Sm-like protein LSm2 [Aphelenchus avenae]
MVYILNLSSTKQSTTRSSRRHFAKKERFCPGNTSKCFFLSFIKSLVGKDVVVELKNDLCICGALHSVDQYLNRKLNNITVADAERHPHILSAKNCFIRGSVVRYVWLPADHVDTQLLQDASRKEILHSRGQQAK